MKKYVLSSIGLFMLSVFTNNIDRAFNSPKATKPFPLRPSIETSIGWYWDYLGDLMSFSFLMLAIVMILHPVYVHFRDGNRAMYYNLYVFTKMWSRVFWVVFVTSMLDIVHFMLAARQIESFFLIQNGVFLLMTGYFIYKAYKQ